MPTGFSQSSEGLSPQHPAPDIDTPYWLL
jgi:hypothetical protein